MTDNACKSEKSHFSSSTAKSIQAFCSEYGISVATFYRNSKSMPRMTRVGRQIRILKEDERAWISRSIAEPLSAKSQRDS